MNKPLQYISPKNIHSIASFDFTFRYYRCGSYLIIILSLVSRNNTAMIDIVTMSKIWRIRIFPITFSIRHVEDNFGKSSLAADCATPLNSTKLYRKSMLAHNEWILESFPVCWYTLNWHLRTFSLNIKTQFIYILLYGTTWLAPTNLEAQLLYSVSLYVRLKVTLLVYLLPLTPLVIKKCTMRPCFIHYAFLLSYLNYFFGTVFQTRNL